MQKPKDNRLNLTKIVVDGLKVFNNKSSCSLDDVINELQEIKNKYGVDFDELLFAIEASGNDYDGSWFNTYIEGHRKETDEEMNARITEAKRFKEAEKKRIARLIEEDEERLYKRLKKKYEKAGKK